MPVALETCGISCHVQDKAQGVSQTDETEWISPPPTLTPHRANPYNPPHLHTSSNSSLTMSSPALAKVDTRSVEAYKGLAAHRGAENTATRMKRRRRVACCWFGVSCLFGVWRGRLVCVFVVGVVVGWLDGWKGREGDSCRQRQGMKGGLCVLVVFFPSANEFPCNAPSFLSCYAPITLTQLIKLTSIWLRRPKIRRKRPQSSLSMSQKRTKAVAINDASFRQYWPLVSAVLVVVFFGRRVV